VSLNLQIYGLALEICMSSARNVKEQLGGSHLSRTSNVTVYSIKNVQYSTTRVLIIVLISHNKYVADVTASYKPV
jgi:hypothetical protein